MAAADRVEYSKQPASGCLIIIKYSNESLNLYPAKLIYSNFYSLEAVSHYHDPQPQVGENYSYLLNLRTNV